jgi:ribosomal-protein-alanine N-acetyltransferase
MERVRLRGMREDDLDAVLLIERDCFPSPWSRENFLYEVRLNRAAANWVLEQGDVILGYACVWFLGPELKINNLAIRRDQRRRGLGDRMLLALLARARELGCETAQLEVRPSNRAALALYRKHGFVEVGRRKNYYRVEGEDAILLERAIAGKGTTRV